MLVCLVFGQTFRYGFVNYDDGDYVYENPIIEKGLTIEGIKWAFTHSHSANWHPLTSMSHMLDCTLSADPGWYHVTNVLLHAATAVFLFLALLEMTEALWLSAFVAAVFAIHPLRVESVAWISERKDVLSGLFFMLTLLAYVRYARNPRSWMRYIAVVIFFALGLMSKPTLVTLPFLLILFDYWPLNRLAPQAGASSPPSRTPLPLCLLIEKIPLFILSAACCAATIWAQGGAIESIEATSFSARIANALVSYTVYIGQMFYPSGLAVLYPRPDGGTPVTQAILAIILLLAISAIAVIYWKKRPYIIVGWLWYLGMLVPMIGIMQVGMQAHADRYTYLPQIGLYLLLAYGAVDLCASMPCRHAILGIAGTCVMIALSFGAWRQTLYWRNSDSLWLRDLACTSHNPIANNNYGYYLYRENRVDEAIAQYQEALKFWPGYTDAHCDLAIVFADRKQDSEALMHYAIALKINPDLPEVHNNMAFIYYQAGEYDEALDHCKKALELKPDYADAHCTMAMTLEALGRLDEAADHYKKSLAISPNAPIAHNNYASLLEKTGNPDEAIIHYRRALELDPDFMDANINLAMALAKIGRQTEAAAYFQKVRKLRPDSAEIHKNAGDTFSGLGFKDPAIAQYEKAVQIKPDYAEAHYNLAVDLSVKGDIEGAISHYQKTLEIDPKDIRAQCNLAWIFATASVPSMRNGAKAIKLAQQANQISGGSNPSVLRTLAAAYAETGQ